MEENKQQELSELEKSKLILQKHKESVGAIVIEELEKLRSNYKCDLVPMIEINGVAVPISALINARVFLSVEVKE